MVKRGADGGARELRELQQIVRATGAPTPDETAMTRVIPDDLAPPDAGVLQLSVAEKRQLEKTVAAVRDDLRFEHLDKKADDAVWRFLCDAALTEGDRVGPFVSEHAGEPQERICYFPVELLGVDEPRELVDATLLPEDHPEVPPAGLGFDPAAAQSVLAVPVVGTHLGRMAQRAGTQADHALRVLRVALRQHRSVHDRQLRFRRGVGFSFGEGLAGWQIAADAGWELGLDEELHSLARGLRIWRIEREPANDLQRQAELALRWLERGMLAAEPLEALLFYFFALEALLGDKSEGLKARGLAFRRALLSVATRGHFPNPDRLYTLYDEVRSAAVHGSPPPPVDAQQVRRFGWDVRDALDEYLEFAQAHDLGRRGRLLRALDERPERDELANWLAEFGSDVWAGLARPEEDNLPGDTSG